MDNMVEMRDVLQVLVDDLSRFGVEWKPNAS